MLEYWSDATTKALDDDYHVCHDLNVWNHWNGLNPLNS